MDFTKLHGLGNDFLVVDLREHQGSATSPELCVEGSFPIARTLCDRRRGVGGDGVLTLNKPRTHGAVATMRVLNSDGSEAEMCGNGLRCVVKYLAELDPLHPEEVVVDTGSGPLHSQVFWQRGEVVEVAVDMGAARLEATRIPLRGAEEEPWIQRELALPALGIDVAPKLSAISMGNPHAVLFCKEAGEDLVERATVQGPVIETHELFPDRTNVEFARIISPSEIELVVWERGCGITQACGTGACATVVAACLAGLTPYGESVSVSLPGGSLWISVEETSLKVQMRGPATHVYQGALDLDLLVAR